MSESMTKKTVTANDITAAEVTAKKATEDAAMELQQLQTVGSLAAMFMGNEQYVGVIDSITEAVLAKLEMRRLIAEKERLDGIERARNPDPSNPNNIRYS